MAQYGAAVALLVSLAECGRILTGGTRTIKLLDSLGSIFRKDGPRVHPHQGLKHGLSRRDAFMTSSSARARNTGGGRGGRMVQ